MPIVFSKKPENPASGTPPDKGPVHILIVDDDPAHIDLAMRAFGTSPEQFRISSAQTLRQARQIIAGDPPHLIIADWMLPDGNGIEILPIRDGQVITPLVVMTSRGDEKLAVGILKSGAIDYVVKSLDMFHNLPYIARRALREWEAIRKRTQAEDAVRESEKRLADIISFLPDATLAIDNKGKVIAWNKAIEQLTGIPAEKMIGQENYEYSIPFVGERRPILIDLVFKNDPDIEKKYFFIRRDGERITSETFSQILNDGKGAYIWSTATPLFDTAGNRVGAIQVIRDITERKRTEETLRESEEKYRLLANNATDIIWILDIKTQKFTYFSPSVEKIRKYTPEEALEIPLEKTFTPDSYALAMEELRKTLELDSQGKVEHGRVRVFEFEEICKDGSVISTEARITFIRNADGDPIALQGISRDITERKRAEAALRESEVRFRDLFNNMSSGVAIYGATNNGEDFIIRDINRAVEIIEQVKNADVIGHSVLEIFPGVKEFGLYDVFKRVAKTGIAEEFPVSLYKDNRISGWRENFVYRLPSGEIVAIYEDVTGKKQAEEALSQKTALLEAQVNSVFDGILIVDSQGKKILQNRKTIELWKIPEYIENNPDDATQVRHVMQMTKNPERFVELVNYLYSHPDKTSRDEVELTNGTVLDRYSAPVLGEDGHNYGRIWTFHDITELKQAEDALKKSHVLLEDAMDLAQMANWEFDALTGIFTFNDRFYTLYGTTAEREGGYQMPADVYAREFVHPDDQYLVIDEVNKAINATDLGYVSIVEHRIIRRDGEVRYIVVRFEITKDAEGRTVKTHGANQDVSDRKKAEVALKESEERYRTLLENVPDYVLVHRAGTILYINSACSKVLGYSPGEVVNQSVLQYIPPEYHEKIVNTIKLRMQGEDIEPYDFEILTKDGNRRTVLAHGEQIEYSGAPASLNVLTDITDRKRAEIALRESEERFRSLIQNSSDMIWILDRDRKIIYESPSTEHLLGYPAGFFIGKDPRDYIYPDDIERVIIDLQKVYDRKNPGIPTEFRIRKADGSYIWVDAIGVNLIGVPAVDGIVITTRSIDERKHLEEEILKSEERLRLALEGADVASWDWDLVTGKAVFSDRFYTMFDYEPGEFPADYENWVSLIHPEDKKKVIPNLEAQIRSRQPLCEIEYRMKDKHGDYHWILGRGKISETDEQGDAVRLTGVNIDITGRKLMESEIRSLNTVLEQRVNERTEQLNIALKEKVLLLQEIHHRVKNNLQIVASLLNLQSRYIKDELVLNAIKESQNRVKAMALVHERLYRSENISKISIGEYVKFLTENLMHFYGVSTQAIKIVYDIKDINYDINRAIPLGLIFNELVSNSLKHAFPDNRKGEISLTGVSGPAGVTIVIKDNGIGMPPGLDWKNTKSLGLQLVVSLVDQLGGTIELAQDGGTAFTIKIPDAAKEMS